MKSRTAGLVTPEVLATCAVATPIMAYSVVQVGANTRSGGVQAGSEMRLYHVCVARMTNGVPTVPPITQPAAHLAVEGATITTAEPPRLGDIRRGLAGRKASTPTHKASVMITAERDIADCCGLRAGC